jgi:putative aldouronate transport system permease protein
MLYSAQVYEVADIIDTYVYRMGIQQAQYAAGAAVGLFKSLVAAVLIGVAQFGAYKFAGYRVF